MGCGRAVASVRGSDAGVRTCGGYVHGHPSVFVGQGFVDFDRGRRRRRQRRIRATYDIDAPYICRTPIILYTDGRAPSLGSLGSHRPCASTGPERGAHPHGHRPKIIGSLFWVPPRMIVLPCVELQSIFDPRTRCTVAPYL